MSRTKSMSRTDNPRLLIVEDDASILESLADFFGLQGFETTAVATAEAADEELHRGDFTLALLDLLLPGRGGLDLLIAMRRRGDTTPVIVITARGEEEQRIEGLRLGADDYLVKPFSVHELKARIEAVLRRSNGGFRRIRIGAVEVDLDAYEILRNGEHHRLQQKEGELLAFLLANEGKTLSRNELLREVWGYDALPTTRTVDTHVFNLRRKIEESPEEPRHLLTVHGVGYRLVR